MSSTYTCSVCGEVHDGLPAWAFKRPDRWLELSDHEQQQGLASDDLCVTPDRATFVRGVLLIPLVDGPEETFEFGIWTNIQPRDFQRYFDSFESHDQSKLGAMGGELANEIKQFPQSRGLGVRLHPRDDRLRPLIELDRAAHPLARAQARGIRYEDALAIVHRQDREIEPAEVKA